MSELSDIQKRCLRLVAASYTSKEIARQVGLSSMTVDQYLSRATALLGATNRRDAARLLVEMEAQTSFNQFEFKPQPVAAPGNSANFKASDDEAETNQLVSYGKRAGHLLARQIGGSRHDLGKLQTLYAILRAALISTAALAALLTTGYWLNSLFS